MTSANADLMKTMVKAVCGGLTGVVVSTKSQRKVRQRPKKANAKVSAKLPAWSVGKRFVNSQGKGKNWKNVKTRSWLVSERNEDSQLRPYAFIHRGQKN